MSDVRDLIIAETIRAPQTADFYVLMVRYGHEYWSALTTHRNPEAAAQQVKVTPHVEEWRIVRVPGLPIFVAPGEAS